VLFKAANKASATGRSLASLPSQQQAQAATFGARMDAAQALAELTEISSQIELALIFDARGGLIEATLADRPRAESLAFGAAALLACTARIGGPGRDEPIQVELTYPKGSVLLVREGDQRILAFTTPDPISGLAFFELRACLRKLTDAQPTKRWLGLRRALSRVATHGTASEGETTSPSLGKDADDAAQ
jgi:predicted regulator of Ras-like GTPase activity (Roadblock/LC7/MglB family)